MKVLTVLGTRPEIIRLSRVIEKLDRLCTHVLVHTGQNYDPDLSDIFFAQLGVRVPDHHLGIAAPTAGAQIGGIFTAIDDVLRQERPDALLILGDTNSALCAIVAKRMGIPVYHMEAGNRAYDDRVPEEVNRRIVDHSSDILMPYTERSRQNLLREGIASDRIFVTGNPILEVIRHHEQAIARSVILDTLALTRGGYMLATLHRAENVDVEARLRDLTRALDMLQRDHGVPIIVSTHPRTAARMREHGLGTDDGPVRFLKPFGFFDFITLERNALCVLSDSGTVQEECALFGMPNVTLRDVTERPETLECGSSLLSGARPDDILRTVRAALDCRDAWTAPREYLVPNVSETAARIILSYRRR